MCRVLSHILLVGISLTSPSGWAALDAEPGQWEITTKVDIPKLPFGLTVPRNLPIPQSGTRRVCVTEEDVEQPQALVRAQTGCLLRDLHEADGRFDWRVSCNGPPRSRGSGSLTVNGESLQGTATVITDVQGFELPVSMRYSGRRLGECSRAPRSPAP
jgi:hypothetical protein